MTKSVTVTVSLGLNSKPWTADIPYPSSKEHVKGFEELINKIPKAIPGLLNDFELSHSSDKIAWTCRIFMDTIGRYRLMIDGEIGEDQMYCTFVILKEVDITTSHDSQKKTKGVRFDLWIPLDYYDD